MRSRATHKKRSSTVAKQNPTFQKKETLKKPHFYQKIKIAFPFLKHNIRFCLAISF